MPRPKMKNVDIDDSSESDGFLGKNDSIAWKRAQNATKLRRRMFCVLSAANAGLLLVSIFLISFSWKNQRFVLRNEANALLKEIDAYCK